MYVEPSLRGRRWARSSREQHTDCSHEKKNKIRRVTSTRRLCTSVQQVLRFCTSTTLSGPQLALPCPVQRTLQPIIRGQNPLSYATDISNLLRAFVFSFAPPTPLTSSFRVRMGELRLPPWHPAGLACDCDDFAGFLKSPCIWLTVHAFISGSFVCFNGHNHRSR